MRKISVIIGVADDRVVPAQMINGICKALRGFRDVRLEFAVVRHAPSSALDMASGDFVVLFDGNGRYSPSDVKKVLAPLLSGQADVVLGNRFGCLSSTVMAARERIANSFLTWMAVAQVRFPLRPR